METEQSATDEKVINCKSALLHLIFPLFAEDLHRAELLLLQVGIVSRRLHNGLVDMFDLCESWLGLRRLQTQKSLTLLLPSMRCPFFPIVAPVGCTCPPVSPVHGTVSFFGENIIDDGESPSIFTPYDIQGPNSF